AATRPYRARPSQHYLRHYPWASPYRFYAWALCRPWSQYCRPRTAGATARGRRRIRRSSHPRVEQEVIEIGPDDGRGLDTDLAAFGAPSVIRAQGGALPGARRVIVRGDDD